MDDQNFDQKTAEEWISTIESAAGSRERDIYPRLHAWVESVSPRKLIEIGCGQGVCSDKINLRGRQYTGLEPSSFLVSRARELYQAENRRFLEGNAYQLPVMDEDFDAAFSVAVWHLLSDLPKASLELSRVLSEDGHFLIITANPGGYDLWKAPYTTIKLEGRRFEGEISRPDQSLAKDVLYFHSLSEIVDALHASGLRVDETETFRAPEGRAEHFLISIRGRKR